MKKFLAVLTIAATVFGFGCGGKKCVFNSQTTPAIYEATFVESSNSGEVMVKASGIGCSIEQATEEAKKTAIWFVLEGGDKPILKNQNEKLKAAGLEAQMYANTAKYIRWTSDIKSKTKDGGKTKLTYLFKVDAAMLTQELAAAEIITTEDELGEQLGLPTISVFADKGGDSAKIAVTVLQEYLQDNSYEVYKQAQSDKVNSLVSKLSAREGGETDPQHDLALSLGTDIYAKVSMLSQNGSVGTKATVTIEVYETASGKMLGSTTGYSAERRADPNALVQEAVNDASMKVLSQIKKEWMEMSKKGKPFKVTVLASAANGSAVDEAVYGSLKALSQRPIKRQAGGKSTFSYIIYIKDIPNAYELFQAVKKSYNGPGALEKVSDSGSFLVFKAAGDGEIELTIE